jgi:hypothetical protein
MDMDKTIVGDGFTPQAFALADVDGDGVKEICVAGSRLVADGGGIGFFKATGPNTYIDGGVIAFEQDVAGSVFIIGTQIGVVERPVGEGDLLFIYMDEANTIHRRVLMISDIDDINNAAGNNVTTIKHVSQFLGFQEACYSGVAASKSDPLENPTGFDVYVPDKTKGVYCVKYNGTGSIYDSTNYTLHHIFDAGNIWKSGTDFGMYKLYAPPDDINGNGRKKLIVNNQLSRIAATGSTVEEGSWIRDTLTSTGVEYHTRNPFWILEWGISDNGVIDVKTVLPIMPEDYILEQNYPNPFNPSTTIRFTLPTPEDISLIIYDINGKEVSKLIDNQRFEIGTFETNWNGKNKDGKNVSSGTYFYKLKWGNFEKSMKMSLLK